MNKPVRLAAAVCLLACALLSVAASAGAVSPPGVRDASTTRANSARGASAVQSGATPPASTAATASTVAAAAAAGAPDPQPWVLASGDTVAVTIAGTGAPVVIVPGMLGGAYAFRKVSAELVAAGRRVIVVEPLGTGRSGHAANGDYSLTAHSARLAEVLDGVGIRGAVVVSQSIGTSIALRLALARPELVARIVSINGGAAERAGTDGLRSALRFAPLIRVAGSGLARRHVRSGLINTSADPRWVTDAVVAAYTASYSEDFGAVLRALRGYADAVEPGALAPRVSAVAAPVHLLLGTGGSGEPARVPTAEIETLRGMPRFTMETVADAGQYIQEERPDLVVQAVLRPR
jgi:pimeloyl-ACP methyl ester carboxylesterase